MHFRRMNATNPFVFTLTASSHIPTTGYKLLIYTHDCFYSSRYYRRLAYRHKESSNFASDVQKCVELSISSLIFVIQCFIP